MSLIFHYSFYGLSVRYTDSEMTLRYKLILLFTSGMPLRTNPQYFSTEAGQLLQFGFLQFLLVQSTQFHWYMIPSNSCFSIFLSSTFTDRHHHCYLMFSLVNDTKYFFQITLTLHPSSPQLPKILELVGLGYTGWFVYRYLLFKVS